MRPESQRRDAAHPAALTAHDHHPQPASVSISSQGVTSLPPGTTYNLDITLPRTGYKTAEIFLRGLRRMSPGTSTWYESAIVHATTDTAEASGHSVRDISFQKVYAATYAKQAGASYLTHKIFDSATAIQNRYIALQDALITGSTLRLTFRNFHGGSAFLHVAGQVLLA